MLSWQENARLVAVDQSVISDAASLVTRHRLQIHDAIIVASVAGEGDVLSEDMQDGFSWRGVTVRNPFAS